MFFPTKIDLYEVLILNSEDISNNSFPSVHQLSLLIEALSRRGGARYGYSDEEAIEFLEENDGNFDSYCYLSLVF